MIEQLNPTPEDFTSAIQKEAKRWGVDTNYILCFRVNKDVMAISELTELLADEVCKQFDVKRISDDYAVFFTKLEIGKEPTKHIIINLKAFEEK
jgi:hypothetical protein